MEIQKQILSNLNSRYVLLKLASNFVIVDKNKKTMVKFDDPIINYQALINLMIANGVVIYNNLSELPGPTEKPVVSNFFPNTSKVFVQKIYNEKGKETGAIISAITNSQIDRKEKLRIENVMEDYAFRVLYPDEGLNVYSSIYDDTASVTVIKGINNLPNVDIDGVEANLTHWP